MLKINPKKLRPYGDRLNDGAIQLSFTFPVRPSPELKEAARIYVEKLGFMKVSIASMEPAGENFTTFVVYAHAKPTVDITRIHVPKLDFPHMDYHDLTELMDKVLDRSLVVLGATTGSDAHTVGIDAIFNMKGYSQDYGLERYPKLDAHNLRAQMSNAELVAKAIDVKADAILVSQIVTQRDSHVHNLKDLKSLIDDNKRKLHPHLVTIIGGPRVSQQLAMKLGFDAGFGPGTLPSQVASFILKKYLDRKGISAEMKIREKKQEKKVLSTPYDDEPPTRGAASEAKKPKGRGRRGKGRRRRGKSKIKNQSTTKPSADKNDKLKLKIK